MPDKVITDKKAPYAPVRVNPHPPKKTLGRSRKLEFVVSELVAEIRLVIHMSYTSAESN